MLKLALAGIAAVLLSGCNMMTCQGAGDSHSAAGDCGLHTTFLASLAAREPARTLGKP